MSTDNPNNIQMSTDSPDNKQPSDGTFTKTAGGSQPPQDARPEIQPRPQPAAPASSGQESGQKQDK